MLKDNRILFLGDVVPYKHYRFRNKTRTVINLECPIVSAGQPQEGKINLSVRENYLGKIFGRNLFSVSLANNHILDYGDAGFQSSLAELDKLGVSSFGYDRYGDGTHNPLITKFQDISVAFFAVVCDSTSPLKDMTGMVRLASLDIDKLIDKVKTVRDSVQRIVVYIHWGTEESSYPELWEIQYARTLVENGVDIVIGSHAHAPQPVERYKSGIIAYNLGNFIMPDLNNIPTYFNKEGVAQSTYNKHTMIWNRISWGILVDMSTLEYRIQRFIFFGNYILRLPFTLLDKYMTLCPIKSEEDYKAKIARLLRKRARYRRLVNFVLHPHIPEFLRKVV